MHVSVTPLVWFWRGLKGHSVTFAALFASVACGLSVAGGVRSLLSALGLHWLYVIIIPGLIFGWLAKREAQWIGDEQKRKRIARSLLWGSLALGLAISWLRDRHASPEPGLQRHEQRAEDSRFRPSELPRR